MENIKLIKEWDDGELYYKDGTNKAVKFVRGFSTGSASGIHNSLNTLVIAVFGAINEDGEFEADAWSEDDFGKGIFSKQMIGKPKVARGWDSPADDEEIDWDEYSEWVKEVCTELLT